MARSRNNFLLIALFFFCAAPFVANADGPYSFSTSPQSISVSAVSGALTLSASSPVSETTCLLLSSDSATGQFSSSATDWNAVLVLTMNKNSQNRTFYYLDATAGAYTLSVRVVPKPDSESASCASWSDAAGNVAATVTQDIAVGGAGENEQTQAQESQEISTTSDSQAQTAVSPGGSILPPVNAQITLESAALAGAGTTFDGAALDEGGDPLLSGVRYIWNFGDGATAEGERVAHTYAYPGRYVVELTVAYNYSSGIAELTVNATQPQVGLVVENDGSLTIENNSADDLDIGGWSLTDGAHTFSIPQGTIALAGGGVRFAPGITSVVGSTQSALLYPNGTRAASAIPSADSPLRGQQVAPEKPVSQSQSSPTNAQPTSIVSATSQIENTDEEPDLSAAAQSAPASAALPLWLAVAGLLALVALGAGAVWYLQAYRAASPARPSETLPSAEEFEIE